MRRRSDTPGKFVQRKDVENGNAVGGSQPWLVFRRNEGCFLSSVGPIVATACSSWITPAIELFRDMALDRTSKPNEFDLLRQPFRRLLARPSATHQVISAALRSAQQKRPADPRSLTAAQDALFDLNERLFHELTFPLACSPAEAEAFFFALETDLSTEEVFRFAKRLSPLDRANFFAHVASHRPAPGELLIALICAHAAIDANDVWSRLGAARQIAELAPPSISDVKDVLTDLVGLHSAAAIDGYESIWDAVLPVSECTSQILSCEDRSRWAALHQLLDCYASRIEGPREDAQGYVETACTLVRDRPNDHELREALGESVRLWMALCRPLLAWQAKTAADLKLETPLEEVRAVIFALSQANQFEAALWVSQATRAIFAVVPTTMEQLKSDARQLTRLSVMVQLEKLGAIVEEALSNPQPFIQALQISGFSPRSLDPASKLWNAFVNAAATTDSELRDLSWKLIHRLTLRLSNKQEAEKALIALLTGLIAYGEGNAPSPKMLKEMRNNFKFMQSFVGTSLPLGPQKQAVPALPQKRPMLRALNLPGSFGRPWRARNKERGATVGNRPLRRVAIGAGVLGAIALAGTALSLRPDWPATFTSGPSAATAEPAPLGTQTMPSVGTAQRLGLEGVRYCHFQQERLRRIKQWIKSPEDVRQLNLLVVDYNSRCSDFFYRDEDLRRVEAEMDANRSLLETEARQIVSSWSGRGGSYAKN